MRKIISASIFALFCVTSTVVAATAPPVGVTKPVGIVMLSNGAQVSQITAQSGTSLYVGDTLTTDLNGSLQVRFGTSQLVLRGQTVVKLSENDSGLTLNLQHGDIEFSETNSPIHLQVCQAAVTPFQNSSGQLRVVAPSEFQIGSTRGTLNVEIGEDTKAVTEGTAYDVSIQEQQPIDQNTKAGGRNSRLKGLWLVIALIVTINAILIAKAFESGSHF